MIYKMWNFKTPRINLEKLMEVDLVLFTEFLWDHLK